MNRPVLGGPFTDPRFRRLLAGESLSMFGDTALYLTLGIRAKSLTHSNAEAGAVFLVLGIPALFAPAAGHLVDGVRRRPLLLGANALTALLVLSLLAPGCSPPSAAGRSRSSTPPPSPRRSPRWPRSGSPSPRRNPRHQGRSAGRSRPGSGTCARCRCSSRSRS